MNEDSIFLFVFALMVFGIPGLVVWASYCESCKIDLRTLWVHQERVDKFAVIILGTWWVHTCSIVLWTLLKTIQTADYVTYMGWAIPIMLKMWAPKDDKDPQSLIK